MTSESSQNCTTPHSELRAKSHWAPSDAQASEWMVHLVDPCKWGVGIGWTFDN